MFELTGYMADARARVDAALDRHLPPESERPHVLHRAMRYSVFCGGKRIRPILCLASAEAAGGGADAAMMPAVALECLHTYTLIHDDLPAMDDDDLRRGRPTSHKVFGEANAILAGDSLLTLAFELLARSPARDPGTPGRLVLELATASGSRGVVGGQFEDLAAEGKPPEPALLERIHNWKTASLIRASCRMGVIAAGGSDGDLEAVTRYAEPVGLAFQVADDILNATSTPEQLGKPTGSDEARKKMTYVALYGLDQARAKAAELLESALNALRGLPRRSEPLEALARFVVERTL